MVSKGMGNPSGHLQTIRNELADCTRCPLHQGRTHSVFGEGDPRARVVFVGEAPGADEDKQGRPFVGRAGKVLTALMEAAGMCRTEVYIANIVKCRPPGNRAPARIEIESCLPFLEAQLAAIAPRIIVTLGKVASEVLLARKAPMAALRGEVFRRNGLRVLPTYHPSFLVRNGMKGPRYEEVLGDLKQVVTLIG